jgi:DNA polymerase III subunit gamma/tau
MASQSLYRKWRSQTFSDLVGQEPVVRTLLNAVRDKRVAHAYLFCGPRGTGKTSAARLLAKAVNCANPRPDGEPCNECLSCREITAGRSPDVIEIDAASNTGVDNIRDLRETVNLLGSGGRYKVYIVDEIHMLSTQAFNALLKTLEEPPPHIIFVLATTEVHKVLPTVVSRCQRFDFRRFSLRDIVARLYHVAQGEGLELEPAAADLLARAAQGGMRDALSLLDQAIAFGGSHVDLERVRAMLGLADPSVLRALIVAVADQRPAEGLRLIDDLVSNGADLRQLNAQLADEWRGLMLARAGADVTQLMDLSGDEAREVAALAARFSLDELMACARIFARNETPARGLPVPQLALELSFLECVSIRAHGGQPAVHPALPAPAPITAPRPVTAAASSPPQPPVAAAPAPETVIPTTAPSAGIWATPAAEPESAPSLQAESDPVLATGEAPAEDAVLAVPTGPADYHDALLRAQSEWDLIKQVCKQKSVSVAALLNSARPILVEPGDAPVLVLQADHRFHLDKLREPKSKTAVEWALEQVLDTPVRVRIAPNPGNGGANGTDTPGSNGPGGNGSGGSPGGPVHGQPTRASGSANGAAPTRVAANGSVPSTRTVAVRDAGQGYASNVTALRPPAADSGAAAAPSLRDEVLADPVIQALMKTTGVELVEVRPLDDEGDV